MDQEDTKPPYIKEEQQELLLNQEGEQPQELDEADTTKFPYNIIIVKSEDNEEKPQISELLQRHSEQLETGDDREDFGGQEPSLNSDLERHSQHEIEVKIEDPSEPETEDSDDDWKARGHQSGLHSENFEDERAQISKKTHNCYECGKTFNDKWGLTLHTRIHTGEKPYGCSECDKRFTSKTNLTKHMRIHTGEKPFSCLECGRQFKRKGNLSDHLSVHRGEKPFSCPSCDKRFTCKQSLTTHMRSHTGEKPFSCTECGKSFNCKGNLSKHMIFHMGEKPFCCSECGNRFYCKSNLIKHMRIHASEKPFSCSECGKSFKCKVVLTRHMVVHTGEKPFSCSECGQRLKRKHDLTRHMTRHREETSLSSGVVGIQASKLYQNQAEETGDDAEDFGGAESAMSSDPTRHLEPETEIKVENFSEPEYS